MKKQSTSIINGSHLPFFSDMYFTSTVYHKALPIYYQRIVKHNVFKDL